MRWTWSRFKAPFALAVAGGTFTRSWHCKPARPGRSRSTAVPLLSEALRENRGQTGRSLPRAEHTSGCHPYIRADLCRNAIGNRQPCHRSSPLTGVPRLGYRSLGDLDRVINLEAKIANPPAPRLSVRRQMSAASCASMNARRTCARRDQRSQPTHQRALDKTQGQGIGPPPNNESGSPQCCRAPLSQFAGYTPV